MEIGFSTPTLKDYVKAVETGNADLFLLSVSSLKKGVLTGLGTAFFIIKNGQQKKLLHLVKDSVGAIEAKDVNFFSKMLLVDFVATNNFVAISSLIHLQLNFNSLLDFDCMKELFCSVSNYRMAHFLSKLGINFVFFLQDDYRFYFIGLIEVIQKRNFEFFFFLETNINDKKQICTVKEYVMWKKIYFRSLDRAANKIRSWWLPICYDVKRESGKRMAEFNFKRFEEMYA